MVNFLKDNWDWVLSSLITLGSIIYSIIYSHKSGNKATIKANLKAMIPALVREAETIIKGNKMGAIKQNYVLTKAILYATEHNVKIDTLELEDLIREEVKTLNYNKEVDKPSEDTAISDNTKDNEVNTQADIAIL